MSSTGVGRAVAVVVLLLGAVGCGAPGGGPEDGPAPAGVESMPVEGPVEPVQAGFGQAHPFASGVTVTVAAAPYQPEASYPGAEDAVYVRLSVQVVNDSAGAVEPGSVGDVTEQGQPVEKVLLAGEDGLTLDPAQILPGQSVRFDEVVQVESASSELVVAVFDPAGLGAERERERERVFFRGVPA